MIYFPDKTASSEKKLFPETKDFVFVNKNYFLMTPIHRWNMSELSFLNCFIYIYRSVGLSPSFIHRLHSKLTKYYATPLLTSVLFRQHRKQKKEVQNDSKIFSKCVFILYSRSQRILWVWIYWNLFLDPRIRILRNHLSNRNINPCRNILIRTENICINV